MTERAEEAVVKLLEAVETLEKLGRHKDAFAIQTVAASFAALPEEIQEEFFVIFDKAASQRSTPDG